MFNYITVILILLALPIFALIPIGIIFSIKEEKKSKEEYELSSYSKITKNPYCMIRHHKGVYGEYETYRCLSHFEAHGTRFLFNLYIPTSSGRTCEIDMVMIDSKGIFVIESKNYSGWIFGSENKTFWYQTLQSFFSGNVSKVSFYNPVFQNRSHVKALKRIIGNYVPFYSLIVFSDACELKKIQIKSRDVCVVNSRFATDAVIQLSNRISGIILTPKDIGAIYDILYPYTQVSDEIKAKHIENINEFKKGDSPNDSFDFLGWW